EAMSKTEHGGVRWCRGATLLSVASGRLGNHSLVVSLGRDMIALCEDAAPTAPLLQAGARVAQRLLYVGSYELAEQLLDLVEAAAGRLPASELGVDLAVRYARATQASFSGGPGADIELLLPVIADLLKIGDLRASCGVRVNVGYGYAKLGQYGLAEAEL